MNEIIKLDQMAKEITELAKQTCPSCGAEKRTYYYGCWTRVDDPMDRHADCYQRQIAAQAAEIERLRGALHKYGCHYTDCDFLNYAARACNCGFDMSRGEVT